MRSQTSSAFLLLAATVLWLGGTAFGAPVNKGRYMWVECKPNSNDPNCVQKKGPWLKIPESVDNWIDPQLPNSDWSKMDEDLNDLFPLSENKPEEDGGSGLEIASGGGPELGSGFEDSIDYSEFVFPVSVKRHEKPDVNLPEENLIL
ncbi:serglycin [Latimeria chalumnae]|uniref:serglycin n=1 Tax=Latimeria chalumnae TaxID=7897 RepID=UPI0006D9120F|nr:PREDICTED: serglycin [Latimeria chalumnae]|eukprot:XP_014340478.1 PREDICTED: serglycin [Latimeria chalumnae]